MSHRAPGYVFTGILTLLALGASTVSAYSSTLKCPRDDNRLVTTPLTGNVNVGNSEYLDYESRIEGVLPKVASSPIDTHAYVYCISNKRQHRVARVRWFSNEGAVYFDGVVPPGEVRFQRADTRTLKFTSAPRILKFDSGSSSPETLLPLVETVQYKGKLSIVSVAVFDVASGPEINRAIDSDKSVDFHPDLFFSVELRNVSELEQLDENKFRVNNFLTVHLIQNTDAVLASLEKSPKFVSPTVPDRFLFPPVRDRRGIRIRYEKGERQVISDNSFTDPGPMTVRAAVVRVTDGEETYGAFSARHFAPSPR